jgi:tetratricopeptide (TPR) repeat protein
VAALVCELAESQLELRKYQEAKAGFGRSLELLERRSATDPQDHFIRARLARALLGMGRVHQALGRSREALDSWTRAVAIMEPIADDAESEARSIHVRVLLHLGRVEQAKPIADALLASGFREPQLLRLCREHGLMVADG